MGEVDYRFGTDKEGNPVCKRFPLTIEAIIQIESLEEYHRLFDYVAKVDLNGTTVYLPWSGDKSHEDNIDTQGNSWVFSDDIRDELGDPTPLMPLPYNTRKLRDIEVSFVEVPWPRYSF